MAKSRSTLRKAAGSRKKPAAVRSKKPRAPKRTKRGRAESFARDTRKHFPGLAAAIKRPRPTAARGKARKLPTAQEVGKAAAVAAEKVVADQVGRGTKNAAKSAARPNATEVPLGLGRIAYVRFDTPRAMKIRAAVESYATKQHAGVPHKTVLFGLMKAGLATLTGKGNLFPTNASELATNLLPAIEAWAAKKWPEVDERPKMKALLFSVIAAGLESSAHVRAKDLSTAVDAPAAAAKPAKRVTSPRPKKVNGSRKPARSVGSHPNGMLTQRRPATKKVKASDAGNGGGPVAGVPTQAANAKPYATSLRVTKEGDQGEPVDDVPPLDVDVPNDDAERMPDET